MKECLRIMEGICDFELGNVQILLNVTYVELLKCNLQLYSI